MILFPAVDLKNGQCVRLEQGDMARATVFNLDPAAQARAFAAQGFEYLHIVDLDGAFAGKPMNAQAVEAMLKAVTMPVQLGGGIRDLKTVEAWLDKGIARVIIGTAAVRDPELVKVGGEESFPAGSPSASMPATAKSRSKAGPRRRKSRRWKSRNGLRMPASPPSSSPTSPATACSRASISTRRLRSPSASPFP